MRLISCDLREKSPFLETTNFSTCAIAFITLELQALEDVKN